MVRKWTRSIRSVLHSKKRTGESRMSAKIYDAYKLEKNYSLQELEVLSKEWTLRHLFFYSTLSQIS